MQATDNLAKAAESLLMPIEAETDTEANAEEPEQETELEPELDEGEEGEAEADDAEAENEASTDEDEASEAGQRQPESFKVKVDGREVEVTLDDLKRSYSGQAYIQKQMQEAAESRKSVQQEMQALQAEQQRFIEFAQAVQKGGLRSAPKPPDPALAATDPLGYVQEEAQYNSEMREYQAQQSQIQHIQSQVSEQRRKAEIEILQQQAAIIAEAIPEFSDPQRGNEVRRKLLEYGVSNGFTDHEMQTINDARAVLVLNKARLWDELQAQKVKAKKAPEPPKNVKPAARRPEPEQLARKRKMDAARKTGSLSAFADLILK